MKFFTQSPLKCTSVFQAEKVDAEHQEEVQGLKEEIILLEERCQDLALSLQDLGMPESSPLPDGRLLGDLTRVSSRCVLLFF